MPRVFGPASNVPISAEHNYTSVIVDEAANVIITGGYTDFRAHFDIADVPKSVGRTVS